MANTGQFRLKKVDGPAESTLFTWVLFDADGTPIAQAVQPAGLISAKHSAEWIQSHSAEATWDNSSIRLFDLAERVKRMEG